MIPRRGSPRPGVTHSRIRLQELSKWAESSEMGWGHGMETVGGCTAGHPSFPSREGLCSCFRPRWHSCFALTMNVDKKLGGTLCPIHMLIFLIVTWLTGSIQAKIIFRKKENLSRWLRFPQAVWPHSILLASRILSPSTGRCSPLSHAQAQMSSPHICITCWHDITLFFKAL